MGRNLQRIGLMFVAVMMLWLGSYQSANASHAMGADITYECLGGDTYRIRVSFYRDCIGIASPGNVWVNVVSQSC